jgi:hypothetical protein
LDRAIDTARKLTAAEVDTNVDKVICSPHMAPARFLGKRGSRFRVILQRDVVYWGSGGGFGSRRNILSKLCAHFYRNRQFDALRGPTGALLIGDAKTVAKKILYVNEVLGGISRITFKALVI